MQSVIRATVKGVFRDRVFQGICMAAVLFPFIPAVAALSMRQVTELSISLSLSLISFILLLLAVFLSGTALWKDIERRYTFSVLGLPLKRSSYLLGKFGGVSLFLILAALFLAAIAALVVWYASGIYPSPRPIAWHYFFLTIFYDVLKYILLVAVAFLFSTASTSFFLPIFGTIAIYLVGNASQAANDFIHTAEGQKLPALVKGAAQGLYFILPNFSAFDLTLNAVYGVAASAYGLLLTFGYFIVYTGIMLFLATLFFSRKEIK